MRLFNKVSATPSDPISPAAFSVYNQHNFDQIRQLKCLSEDQHFAIRVVAQVLPFRVNQYVVDHLIQWDDVPDDPMFRLVFPQPEMLAPEHFSCVAELLRSGADKVSIRAAVQDIRRDLNPHPAGQTTLNVPRIGNEYLRGAQHKYRETLLFFPSKAKRAILTVHFVSAGLSLLATRTFASLRARRLHCTSTYRATTRFRTCS